MPIPRVWVPGPLAVGAMVRLPEAVGHHMARVLRIAVGAPMVLFDGTGGEYTAVCAALGKNEVSVRVEAFVEVTRESPLHITLVQGISRGERMDYTLQKAVELGVMAVVPLFTARCGVELRGERRAKREEHWRGVILSACEQSGRTRVPILTAAQGLEVFLATSAAPAADEGEITKLVLSPGAIQSLREIAIKRRVVLAVGPEGGFAQPELPLLQHAGFQPVRLGPRIFRTETAALVALSILQSLAGDL